MMQRMFADEKSKLTLLTLLTLLTKYALCKRKINKFILLFALFLLPLDKVYASIVFIPPPSSPVWRGRATAKKK